MRYLLLPVLAIALLGCATSPRKPTVMDYYMRQAAQILGPLPSVQVGGLRVFNPDEASHYRYRLERLALELFRADYVTGQCPARCPDSAAHSPEQPTL